MTQGWDKAQVQAAWGRACYEQVYPFVLVGAANTSGQVLCFRGEPIYPMYHYANAGVSRTHGSLPYLQSVSCPKDHLAPGAYKTIALPKEAGVLVELWQTDQQGYCEEIALGDIHEPAESFSRDHDLPSVYYTLEEGKEAYLVTALGRGSGYGLSQWTALQMALEGKNAGEILGYFYKGCEVP